MVVLASVSRGNPPNIAVGRMKTAVSPGAAGGPLFRAGTGFL
jgi:hypothetical protein